MMGPGFSLYRDLASRQCQQPAQTNSRLSGSHTMSSLLDVPSEAYLSGRNSDLDLLKAFSNASHLASILFSPSMFPMGPPSRYHISLGIFWLRNLFFSLSLMRKRLSGGQKWFLKPYFSLIKIRGMFVFRSGLRFSFRALPVDIFVHENQKNYHR